VLAETNNKKNGEILYAENCAECHSLSLRGSSHGNELIGRIFIEKWQNKFELLFSVIANTMPPGNNHKISNSDYLEILSYILEKNNITVNKNGVPNDPRSFVETSGIRIGTAAETTRGLEEEDFMEIAKKIVTLLS